jgi:uncharacterized protein YxjI
MLDRKLFLVKERVGFLKLTDTFDIHDPATGTKIGIAQEKIGTLSKLLRLVVNKRLLPTNVEVRETEAGPAILSIKRGFTFLRSKVRVLNKTGQEIGRFKSKLFSFGGGFHVLDAQEKPFAEIKGDWKGWNFRFLSADGTEIGKVTKKWAGIGKELFTSADNYLIALDERKALTPDSAALLLAAGIAIDVVYKEK